MTSAERRMIGLTGVARSGKDTAAEFLVDRGWTRLAFADEVKAMALDVDPVVGQMHLAELVRLAGGWEAAKQHHEVRRFLQRLGTEGIRSRDPEFWVRIAMRRAAEQPGPVVFTDVRFANEADAVRAAGGIVVRIDRPRSCENIGANAGHASERIDFAVDAVVVNDGTYDDLRAKVLAACGYLGALAVIE